MTARVIERYGGAAWRRLGATLAALAAAACTRGPSSSTTASTTASGAASAMAASGPVASGTLAPASSLDASAKPSGKVRVVLFNQTDRSDPVRITIDGKAVYDQAARPTNVYPKIVDREDLEVAPGAHTVHVQDDRGFQATLGFNLADLVNVVVYLNKDGIDVEVNTAQNPIYY
jgi:hypothetical protein